MLSTSSQIAQHEHFLLFTVTIVGWILVFQFFKRVVSSLVQRHFGYFSPTTTTATPTTTRGTFAIFATSSLHSLASSLHAMWMMYEVMMIKDSNNTNSNTVNVNNVHPRFTLHLFAEFTYYIVDTINELFEKVSSVKDDSENGKKSTYYYSKAKILKTLFLLHHFPLLVGYALYIPWSIYTKESRPEVYNQTTILIMFIWTVHLSTPFQNLKWMLDKMVVTVDEKSSNKTQNHNSEQENQLAARNSSNTSQMTQKSSTSLFYKLNFFIFLVIFFLLRIVGVYPLIMSLGWMKNLPEDERSFFNIVVNHLPLKCAAGTALLYVLNIGWFLQNLRTASKIFFGGGGGGDLRKQKSKAK